MELSAWLSVSRLLRVGYVIRNGKMHFRLLGRNLFNVKERNERFTAAGSCCRRRTSYENFTSSFGRLGQKLHQKADG